MENSNKSYVRSYGRGDMLIHSRIRCEGSTASSIIVCS